MLDRSSVNEAIKILKDPDVCKRIPHPMLEEKIDFLIQNNFKKEAFFILKSMQEKLASIFSDEEKRKVESSNLYFSYNSLRDVVFARYGLSAYVDTVIMNLADKNNDMKIQAKVCGVFFALENILQFAEGKEELFWVNVYFAKNNFPLLFFTNNQLTIKSIKDESNLSEMIEDCKSRLNNDQAVLFNQIIEETKEKLLKELHQKELNQKNKLQSQESRCMIL